MCLIGVYSSKMIKEKLTEILPVWKTCSYSVVLSLWQKCCTQALGGSSLTSLRSVICDYKYLTFRWGSSQQRIGPLIHCYPSVSGQTESREVRVCSSYQHWQLAELSVHKRPSQDIKEAQDKLSIHLDDNHGAITKLTGVWLCTIMHWFQKKTYTPYMTAKVQVHRLAVSRSRFKILVGSQLPSLQLWNCCHETYIDFSSQVAQNICLQVNLQYKLMFHTASGRS